MDPEISTETSFPYRFCYKCKHLVFSKDQSRNLLPRLDEVTCDADVCASEEGCLLYCPEVGQSLLARYIRYDGDPSTEHTVYGVLK